MVYLYLDLQQATILRESLQGFVFESNRGTQVNVMAESSLGSQFQFGWSDKKGGKKAKTKVEQIADKVYKLAHELQAKYFSVAHESTRKVMAEMRVILVTIESACNAHDMDLVSQLHIHLARGLCVCVYLPATCPSFKY